jgi:hypothetical protein
MPTPVATDTTTDSEPFVRERSVVVTPSFTDAINAVSGTYKPVNTVDDAVVKKATAALDARWGKPWNEHLPKAVLSSHPELDTWATSLARSAVLEIDTTAATVVDAHALATLRAEWLAALSGAENLSSEPACFARLLAECRSAVEEVENTASKARASYGTRLPKWLPQWLADERDALALRIVANTGVAPSFVRYEAESKVEAAARELVTTTRDRVLDAETAAAVARQRASILAFARPPKKP